MNTIICSKNGDQSTWHYIFTSNHKSWKVKLAIDIEVPSFLVSVPEAHVHL